jgi:hypothetical protein
MSGAVIEIVQAKGKNRDGEDDALVVGRAVYEHPFVVRLCHWLNTVSLFVMVGSGLQIFRAFPSFGAKIPQKDLLHWPRAFAIGGWLGGAPDSFIWATSFSAETIDRFCLRTGTFQECGRW